MSLIGSYPITLVEGEDFGPIVLTYYPVVGGSPANWAGYTATWVFRKNLADVAAAATFTPTLGGSAGTLTLSLTAAQVATVLAALSYGSGYHGVQLTSGGGVKTMYFDGDSGATSQRSAPK